MNVSLIGNYQTKALTWYIQQLNANFDVKYIWTDIGMAGFAKRQVWMKRSVPTITNIKTAQDRLRESNYIVYQPIRPDRIADFNYEDIQQYNANSKLISIGCFYCQKLKGKTVDTKEYHEKTGLLGMKERAKKFKLDIKSHKIIEK